MTTLFWFAVWLFALLYIAYERLELKTCAVVIGVGLVLTTMLGLLPWWLQLPMWALFAAGAMLTHPEAKSTLAEKAFNHLADAMPPLSKTERDALESGTVSWEGELFNGKPNWKNLTEIPKPTLTKEEQDFIQGPVQEACEMTNDWQVTHHDLDLTPQTWQYLKDKGFFGIVIPKEYGGKEFSEMAHSEILTILAGRSVTLSTTVAVPNSLGPAMLLVRYGTKQQKNYYLPRLAKGLEVPCFALTSQDAGSDATALTDYGIVEKREVEGKQIIGIRLNWKKRYITLAPVATILGLAFKMFDPKGLLGSEEELGITCALIPTNTPGVKIGNRHLPLNITFQNGPTEGKDVFVPIDCIIGGEQGIGQGWRMLVECLSVGRAISLPASSCGGAKVATLSTGAYSQIRRQFRTPLAKFEGIQEALARICGYTYAAEAIRKFTVNLIDQGERPSVPTAISKYHVTELGRKIAQDSTDIHAGKAIMLGPNNYLARGYQSVPISITVEGANILTRCMIIFGQGVIRCHPFVLKEMQALQDNDKIGFAKLLQQHIGHTTSNAAGSLLHALTGSKLAKTPEGPLKFYYQQLSRACCAMAFVSDVALLTLGGKLKFKESLSARLGDLLSMTYIMSSVLKRFEDEGKQTEDKPLAKWTLNYCLNQYWHAMQGILANMPNKVIGRALKVIIMPLGKPHFENSDKDNKRIVGLFTKPSETRQRLTDNTFISQNKNEGLAAVENAFQLVTKNQDLLERFYNATKSYSSSSINMQEAIQKTLQAKIIDNDEAKILVEIDRACSIAISVDDFNLEGLGLMAQNSERFIA
jgi:acyl-CoA dehydrogenase